MLDGTTIARRPRQCSIAAALEAVGERWSFLILRAAFNGLAPFRGIPVDARHRPQHPLEPARPAGRERHPGARARSRRPAQGRLPADRQGTRPAAGADLAPPVGRALDLGHAEQPGAGRPPQPASRRADGGRSADGRTLALGELEWIDRTGAAGGRSRTLPPADLRRLLAQGLMRSPSPLIAAMPIRIDAGPRRGSRPCCRHHRHHRPAGSSFPTPSAPRRARGTGRSRSARMPRSVSPPYAAAAK